MPIPGPVNYTAKQVSFRVVRENAVATVRRPVLSAPADVVELVRRSRLLGTLVGVDGVGFLGVVAPRQVGLQQLEPDALGGIALRAGVAEGLARCCQTALDV